MGSTLLPVKLAGHATSTRFCGRRYSVTGVARDAGRWHRRGARRGYAADSVHCRPYAKPRVECPRWVGLTEGAAPSACDHNDCRKGVEPLRTQVHRIALDRSCARCRPNDIDHSIRVQLRFRICRPCSLPCALPRALCMHTLSVQGVCLSVRRWCGSGRQLSSTPGPLRHALHTKI